MGSFFREHFPWISALSTGIMIGASSTTIYFQLSRNLAREVLELTSVVNSLRKDIAELREKVANRKKKTGYCSVQPSSGDDDDEFEEAYGGSDLEGIDTGHVSDGYLTANEASDRDASRTSFSDFFAKADKLLDGKDPEKEQAYKLIHQKRDSLSRDPEFLWRYAKSTYFLSQIEDGRGNQEKKKDLAHKAKDIAFSALLITDQNANVHKWCSITLGNLSDYKATKDKISDGFEFRTHIEKAISLNPKDSSSQYLLGRWCYGVYMLSWIERKVAATLFATPPSATIEEALEHFLEAENLNPGMWKENMLYIAKCHIEKRQYQDAVEWMEKGSRLAINGQDDRVAQKEIDTLLVKYRQ
ncbi:regulator of microtubule dynamics protein 2-like [Lineus longissimus]|uniref:regulator of microtubule dynamics protein 2-like n=1 Tax=Lineus longissimus TaxID=88925 RepID=UPI002B4EAC12